MKHIVSYSTRVLVSLFLIQILSNPVKAQNYNINSSTTWSAALPATCNNCTINIGSAATLTVNETATCENCTFTGGTVSIASHNLTLKSTGVQTTTFNGTNLNASGTAQIIANSPLSLSNAIFTFNNTSSLTTAGNVSLTGSTINLDDNSSMTSNGNLFNTVSLMNNSKIQIGSGSVTSNALYTMNGPTMVVYDSSTVTVANQNNVFYNAADYIYLPSTSASIFTAKVNNTSNSTLNCGAGYANACAANSVFGPASVASSVTPIVSLPVILDGFTAELNDNHTVTLNWSTAMEVNFSHFTIQRSADGLNWEEIGTVQGVSNSAAEMSYSFTDPQPLTGANYYRLMLVNLDDTYTYSDVKVLQEATIAKVSFFPNPARDYVNVSLGGDATGQVTILLSSISGQLLQEKTAISGNGSVVSFPIQNLAAGMYVLSVVHTDGTRESSPVMITR